MRAAPRLAAPTGAKRRNGGMTVTAAGSLPGGSNAFGALGTGAQTPARQAWQFEAWGYADAMPELHYGMQFVGSCMSRIKLRLGWLTDNNDVAPVFNDDGNIDEECPVDPQTIANAAAILAAFRDPLGGPAALLEQLGKNLTVTGEAHLLARDLHDENGTVVSRRWEVLSTDEIRRRGSVKRDKEGKLLEPEFERVWGAGRPNEPIDPKTSFVLRIYRRHPRWSHIADAATRPLLDIMEVLVLLARQLRATVLSRLAGAGVLWIPSEMDLPDDETAPEGTEEEDPFARKLFKNMTTPISDRGSASSVVPLVIRADADLIPAVHHLTFETKDDEIAMNKMAALLQRFAQGMDLPVEVILGHMNCVDEETQILTERGWQSREELTVGDQVLTLNHETGLSEWQPIEHVNQFPVSQHPMVSFEGRNHSSLSTLDHRWPVISGRGNRRWVESAKLKNHHRFITGAPGVDLPMVAKYADEFVEVVSWFWTEGTTHPNGAVTIYQSERVNPGNVARIRAALTSLYGPASDAMHRDSRSQKLCEFPDCGWPVHGNGLCNAHRDQKRRGIELRPVRRLKPRPAVSVAVPAWRESRQANGMVRFYLNPVIADDLLDAAPEKVVTFEFLRSLTRSQVEMFIQASVDADGHRHPNGDGLYLKQSSQDRLAAWEFACILSGRSVGTYSRRDAAEAEFPDGSRCATQPQWQTRASRPAPQRLLNMRRTEVFYTGTIWCPTVKNGTWLARRGAHVYFTGNTTFANAVQVDESTFKAHLEPMIELICGFLTAGYLWGSLGVKRPVDAPYDEPTLIPLPGQEVARLVITYDASALVTHENREKNAIEAGIKSKPPIIGPSSTRRALGFSDADALTDEERDEWIRVQQLIGVKETIRAEDQGLGGISLADPDVQDALDPGTQLPEADNAPIGTQ